MAKGTKAEKSPSTSRSVSTRAMQDVVVLGLLLEGPRHGYELKHMIDERLRYLTEITSGTVYYTLKKLERSGLVTSAREREGERPERNVYTITGQGREAFQKQARQCLFSPEHLYSPFNVGLYFLNHLRLEDVLEAIDFQRQVLMQLKSVADRLEESYPETWPAHFRALKERQVHELETLLEWNAGLQERLQRRLEKRKSSAQDALEAPAPRNANR